MNKPTGKPHKHRTHRATRWPQKLLIALLALYVLYAVVAFFAIPGLLSARLGQLAEEHLGSHFEANALRFNPFNLSLRIDKPRLTDLEDGTTWWKASAVTTNLDGIGSLVERGLVLDALVLEEPEATVKRTEDGLWRYPRLKSATQDNRENPTRLKVHVRQLAVEAGQLHWQEKGSRPLSMHLKRVKYHHEGFNTGSRPSHFQAQLETAEGERLNLEGSYVHRQPAIDARWEIDQVNIPHWVKSLRLEIPGLMLQKATLSGSGSLHWRSAGEPPEPGFVARELTLGDVVLGLPLEAPKPDGEDASATDTGDEAGIQPLLEAPAITIQGVSLNEKNKTVKINSMGVDGALFHAPLEALEKLATRETAATEDAAGTAPGASFSWHIADISFTNGQLQVESKTDKTGPVVGITSLRLQNLSDSDTPASVNAELRLPGDSVQAPGTARLSGEFSLNKGSGTFSHQLEKMSLRPWLPVFKDYLRLSDLTGVFSSQGQWQWHGSDKIATTGNESGAFSGTMTASLSGFSLTDSQKRTLLAWKNATLGETRIDSAKRQLALGPARIEGLASEVRLEDTGHNLKALLPLSTDPAQDPESEKDRNKTKEKDTKPWHIELNTVALTEGELSFRDARVKPPFQLHAKHINATLVAPKNPESRAPATFTAKANLGQFTRATAKGQLQLNNNPPAPRAEGGIRNLDLSQLSAYARQYLGYDIKSGKADVDLQYQIQNQRLKGELDLTIVKLKLDKADNAPAALNLPLKTALALLTDSKGVTRLRIPIQGNLSDPDFSIGHLVIKAFVNVITGVATSPFKILAKLTGLGKENLREILFDPGDDALRATESAKLQKLATALKERPAVGLQITGLANRPRDSQALRYRKLLADLALPASTSPQSLPKLFLKDTLQDRLRRLYIARLGFARWAQLQEQYGANPVKLAMQAWQQLLQDTVVSDKDLRRLAESRAHTVNDYLLQAEGMPASRLKLGQPVLDDKKPPQARLDVLPVD